MNPRGPAVCCIQLCRARVREARGTCPHCLEPHLQGWGHSIPAPQRRAARDKRQPVGLRVLLTQHGAPLPPTWTASLPPCHAPSAPPHHGSLASGPPCVAGTAPLPWLGEEGPAPTRGLPRVWSPRSCPPGDSRPQWEWSRRPQPRQHAWTPLGDCLPSSASRPLSLAPSSAGLLADVAAEPWTQGFSGGRVGALRLYWIQSLHCCVTDTV